MAKKTGLRVLNVGCGLDTYGSDFIDKYPNRKGVLRCDLDRQRFPYKDDVFDEVYSRSNFEHLRNPLNFLEESYRVLKTGGKLVVITDNAGFFGPLGTTHYGKYEANTKYGKEDRHFSLYTPHHLKNWLESVGFKEVKVHSYTDSKLLWALTVISKRLATTIKAEGTK